MVNWYSCPQCKKIYLREPNDTQSCDTCGSISLTPLEDRFILRCKKCGLTQVQRVYLAMPDRNALKCQNSTCEGIVKAVTLGGGSSSARIGDRALAPEGNKYSGNALNQSAIPERQHLADVKSNSRSNVDQFASAPSPIPRRSLPSASNQKIGSKNAPQNLAAQSPELFNFFGARPLELGKETHELKPKTHGGIQIGDVLELEGEWYEVLGKIGTGGMGAVHKGQNIRTKAFVAIKEFFYTRYHDPEKGDNKCESYWLREQEITKIQSGSSENCMHYVGALKLEQFQIPEYYIFLEFIEGKGLDKWYTDRYKTLNDLTLDELRMLVNRILMPMSRHMYFVHQQGIVHRDLTVQNIMILESEEGPIPIIIDWGVAKEIGIEKMFNPHKPYYVSSAPEATGIRNRGTPPEVMAGFEPIAASDIYMLGHVMFFLFSGGHYCSTAATNEDFILHPLDLNPNLPHDFNKLVEYMTQYEPADRMPDMVKVYEALKWLYETTGKPEMEESEAMPVNFLLICDLTGAIIPIPEKTVVRIGREEILSAGQNHKFDEFLYDVLMPIEGDQFQLELYIDEGNIYLHDLYSKLGTFLNNLTMPNQQIYNNVAIKGVSNCYIPISDVNLNNTTIDVPFYGPDKTIYKISFKIIPNSEN